MESEISAGALFPLLPSLSALRLVSLLSVDAFGFVHSHPFPGSTTVTLLPRDGSAAIPFQVEGIMYFTHRCARAVSLASALF